jgi:hypothetical protein
VGTGPNFLNFVKFGGLRNLRVGKIPNTEFPNPNYPNPDPKYSNPNYLITISDSDRKNPKLVWVIQVMFSSTELPEISQIFALLIPNMKT